MPIPYIAPYSIPACPKEEKVNWQLDPQRCALLVHDMQEYFLAAYEHDASPFNIVESNIRKLIQAADEVHIPVFFSAQPPQQSTDRRGLLVDFWGEGLQTDHDAAIISSLSPDPDNPRHHVLTKWRYSAFARTDLRETLAFTNRDQLLIYGVYGHMGCKVTAVDAFMNDIQPFLINDALADFSVEEHQHTTTWVAQRCGTVTTTAVVTDCLAHPEATEGAVL